MSNAYIPGALYVPETPNGYYYIARAVGQDRDSQEREQEAFDALFTLKPPTAAQYRRARGLPTRLERRIALRRLDMRRERRRMFMGARP